MFVGQDNILLSLMCARFPLCATSGHSQSRNSICDRQPQCYAEPTNSRTRLEECALQGMWRTPHPDPNPLDGSTSGLSGAIAIAMAYLPDGTVVFTERPHAANNGPNNPLLVDVSRVRLPPDLSISSSAKSVTHSSEHLHGG